MSLADFQNRLHERPRGWHYPVRWALSLGELVYRNVVNIRNARYDATPSDAAGLSVPVVSVGNITVGGTGKTPVVMDIVGRLRSRGRCPAVVARGYGSGGDGWNDELAMIARKFGDVLCIANPNRVDGGAEAVEGGADVVVLDDGFQHRRIARDLDIVLIDATCPFGFDHVLPLGRLREPVENLKRADVVIVTRVDLVDADALDGIVARVLDYVGDCDVLRCCHRPVSLTDFDGREPSASVETATLLSGIANPGAFTSTVRMLGIEPRRTIRFPDHHRYTQADIDRLASTLATASYDAILTTAKDATKLRSLDLSAIQPIYVVEIAIDYFDDDERVLERLLDEVLR
jgi:tetraacyldisaccharide 4'-kinase